MSTLRPAAEQVVAGLAGQVLVCTGLRVELTDDLGGVVSRRWLHPRFFTAADVLDRVHWQLAGGGLGAPVARVDLLPEDVEPQGAHTEGLWGGGPDDHVHQALTRVQSRLGHRAVGTSVVGGGRGPADRTTFVPWGDRPLPARPGEPPWPGGCRPRCPPPCSPAGAGRRRRGRRLPRRPRRPGHPVGPTGPVPGRRRRPAGRGLADRAGSRCRPGPVPGRPTSAGGPTTRPGHLARLQVVGVDGSAWLLLVSAGQWWVEARYD